MGSARSMAWRAGLFGVTLAMTCGSAAAAGAPAALTPAELDSVTSGTVRMDLELSANAQGPTAMTSTQGSVTVGTTTVLRVEMDPSAPAEAQARLLGASAADVGIAVGKAQASGSGGAQCSADVGTTGADYVNIAQSRDFTAVAATCSCTAVAIGFLTH